MPARRPLAATALAALVLAAGCGGSNDETQPTSPSAEKPPPRLSSGDQRAYAAISGASGALRAAAVPAAYGSTLGIAATERLNAARRAVARTQPRNARLRRLRARTVSALEVAASAEAEGGPTAKQIAKDAIAEADRIDAGLRRYASSHPAANDVAPG